MKAILDEWQNEHDLCGIFTWLLDFLEDEFAPGGYPTEDLEILEPAAYVVFSSGLSALTG